WLLGTTAQTHTLQDHAKLKLAYDFSPTLRASYTLGWWRNDAVRASDTYLRDAGGNPVYSGSVNIDGRTYSVAATDFAPSHGDLQHFIHGLSLKSATGGLWDWEVAASLYDYDRDEVRMPTVALPNAATGGAGRITDQSGTGWNTLALKATWRPGEGAHIVDFGYQRDSYQLRTLVSNTLDWLEGQAASRFSAFHGDTQMQSLYAQDTWQFAPLWRATLGLRAEDWRASDGSIANATSTLTFPERSETWFSPKAAIAWQFAPQWSLKASLGRAIRTPTVAELYQGSISTNVIVNNDPDLQPEKSWTAELTAQRSLDRGALRATIFHEDTRDALYSQTNVTVTPSVTSIQNVDHIRTTGAEIAYEVADLGVSGLDVSTSVTCAHSRIVANDNFPASVGKWQPRVPDWRANVLATYRIGEKWVTTLGARYSGQQYNTLDNSDPNGMAYTGVSNFFTVDARLRYRITEQVTASLSADNLNGDNYWNFHHYPQRSYAAEVNVDF
ncbi:MAG TPA: TonB-dependent receptor, partial [Povalibacter sp.]|nr:TonB-dependent receptor [Povalibacter sp.]